MKTLRLLEAASAILASLLGLAPVAFLLYIVFFARLPGQTCQPSTRGAPVTCTQQTWLERTSPDMLLFIFLCAFMLIGIGVVGIWHSRTNAPSARIALWLFAGILALGTLLLMHSAGFAAYFLLPSVVLTMLACASSLGNRVQSLPRRLIR